MDFSSLLTDSCRLGRPEGWGCFLSEPPSFSQPLVLNPSLFPSLHSFLPARSRCSTWNVAAVPLGKAGIWKCQCYLQGNNVWSR